MNTRNVIIALGLGLLAGSLASAVVPGDQSWVQALLAVVIGSFVGRAAIDRAGVTLTIENEYARDTAVATLGAVIVLALAQILS